MLRTKSLAFEGLKAVSPEGSFSGLLSPYSVVDDGGDLIEPGAYGKNIQEQGLVRPLLWQHQTDVPIGQLTLTDTATGLYCKGQLLMSLPEAQKAYALIKSGIVSGLSIGFQSIRDSIENGVRHLKEIRLFEGSIVTFPMAEMAQITSVKSFDEQKIRRVLAEFKRDVLAALERK